ncbi:MAG: TRAP transporter large permease subunit [Chlorobiota bacterium]|nr:MAG: TRAP transporter large permease subunit [Chlorobiota bacterium]
MAIHFEKLKKPKNSAFCLGGVIIAMNLQTSFLTPPFGFALFYLRSVAAKSDYTDRITQQRIPAVSTTQIYKGAIAFIVIQVVMVAAVISWPNLVLDSLDKNIKVNIENIQLEAEPGGYGEEEKAEGAEQAPEGEEAGGEAPGQDKEDDPAAELLKEMAEDRKKGK